MIHLRMRLIQLQTVDPIGSPALAADDDGKRGMGVWPN